MILAGDIGGTKTALGLFEDPGEALTLVREAEYPSAAYGSLSEIVAEFLGHDRTLSIRAACLGVAGPVVGGRAKLTNLPWLVDAQMLADEIPSPRFALLNDLQTTAIGALHIGPEDVCTLNADAGPEVAANIAVIAAGTGLGQGFLFWDGERYRPGASEGGHADFAPRNDDECDLLRFLQRRYAHASCERVLSGSGLAQIYAFERMRCDLPEPEWLTAELKCEDPAAIIAEAGLAGRDPVCMAALGRFVEIYGAEAGNLALKVFARGGVFVAGGIAPKILPALRTGSFMKAFAAKGRFEPFLSGIPVKVVLNPQAALIGAAHFARSL